MILEHINNLKSIVSKIRGAEIEVQIDETAICQRKIIINPSSKLNDI